MIASTYDHASETPKEVPTAVEEAPEPEHTSEQKSRLKVPTSTGTACLDEVLDSTICTLSRTAVSDRGKQMIEGLVGSLVAWEHDTKAFTYNRRGRMRTKHHEAVEAFVGDLLAGAAEDDSTRWASLPVATANFTEMPVGRAHFQSIRAAMEGLGLLESIRGAQWVEKDYFDPESGLPSVSKGYISRFRLTRLGLRFIEGFGVTPENLDEHFRLGLPPKPLRLRSASFYRNGKKFSPQTISFKWTPQSSDLRDQLHRLNEWLLTFVIEGQPHWGFRRSFSEGTREDYRWNKGGRLYSIPTGRSTYQQADQKARLTMTINGEAVSEVDVSSSHLTLLYGLAGVPLDLSGDGDLYTFPGLSRSAVKTWITATLGKGTLVRKWSAKMIEGYLHRHNKSPNKDGGDLTIDSPATILRAMVDRFPLLNKLKELDITWADLQYSESCAIAGAMDELKNHGIPSLPVHDSLIVRSRDVEITKVTLKDMYLKYCGIEPRLKVSPALVR